MEASQSTQDVRQSHACSLKQLSNLNNLRENEENIEAALHL